MGVAAMICFTKTPDRAQQAAASNTVITPTTATRFFILPDPRNMGHSGRGRDGVYDGSVTDSNQWSGNRLKYPGFWGLKKWSMGPLSR